jgi:hypothetical protein
MVDVCMGKNNTINGCRVKSKMTIQKITGAAFSLKQPTIQQQFFSILSGDKVLGSGYPAGSSVKSYIHGVNIFIK